MLLAGCFLIALALLGVEGQAHSPLHSICHNNQMEMNEDQVIETVVQQMDANHDGHVVKGELLYFFSKLMGHSLEFSDINVLLALGDSVLQEFATLLEIPKHDFTHNWHTTYHDSMEFISATFDAWETMDGTAPDGILSANEIMAVIDHAIGTFDYNGDGILQNPELIAFLEHIYKNC